MQGRSLALVLCLFAAVLGSDQNAVEPPAGSPLRKAVLDTFRIPVQKELGGKVIFVVSWLKVAGRWAYLQVEPKRPGGKPIDYSKTKYREAYESQALDSTSLALLQKKGAKWKVIRYAIGPTDYPVEEWLKEIKGVPKSIFPHGN